jgi:uncharacterized protein YcgL (UPF0745 family)
LHKEYLYLYIKSQDDFSEVPPALIAMMGTIEFVMALALSPERKLVCEDVGKVMEHLQDKGYFVQMPRTETSVN